MITISDTLKGILSGNTFQLYNRLISIQGGVVLADDIPAVDVREEADASLRVPETLTFSVPIMDRGVSWVPSSYDHPLGIWGQRIVAQVGVGVASGQIEWLTRGQFLIISADTAGDSVSVQCAGLLYLVDEASLVSEYQPKASATLGSIIRALIEPGLTVDLTAAPVDRTAPSNVTWSDNRLDNVANALDAWPAQAEVTVDGVLKVTAVPAEPVTPDFVLSDTVNVEQFSSTLTRDGAFNAVVGRGAYPDTAGGLAGQEIVATAYDLSLTSPFRYGGPFSPYLVPFGYESPLMTTPTMVQAAVNTRLRTLRTTSGRTIQVDSVPHPAVRLQDAVSVTSERLGLSGALGRVQSYGLGHQPANAGAPLTVRLRD
jgi:hypothetical protein